MVSDECEKARAELRAAQTAYDEMLMSSRKLKDGAVIPRLHMIKFEKAFRRRQEAEKRVDECCGRQPGHGSR